MQTLTATTLILCSLLGGVQSPDAVSVIDAGKLDRSGGLEITGGLVWDGERFTPRVLRVLDGVFVEGEFPGGSEPRRIDASGTWLIPPLSDAHTHRFSSSFDAAGAREMYLSGGVLYAGNLCCPSTAREDCGAFAGGERGLDVLFTNGALTCTRGHPVKLYEDLHVGAFRQPLKTFLEVNADSSFYQVDDLADLDAKWPLLLETEPDLVKVILASSEEYDVRRGDDAYYGRKGLDPELLPEVVSMARSDGLRVVAHVDTAADFRIAVAAGVALLAHTPGAGIRSEQDRARYTLTAEDARLAKESGAVQITTVCLAAGELAKEVLAHNLTLLIEAGVPVIIGSDQWENGHVLERDMLLELGVFEPDELLRAWCEATPKALWPERKLGKLDPGYEGSLVMLSADPLADPSNLDKVDRVIKQGLIIWDGSGD